MIFDEAVDQNLNRSLKKIRIKVDPLYSSYTDFKNINSYEGYVVTETSEMLRIMVIKPGLPVITIPRVGIMSDDRLNKFKGFLVGALKIEEGEALFEQLKNCSHLEDIEVFLKQAGKQDIDLIDLYRNYIKRNE